MLVYAVDLGTTNTKVALYDEQLHRLSVAQEPTALHRSGPRVEFDAPLLLRTVLDLIARCARAHPATEDHEAVIAVSGQAESLSLVAADAAPVRPAMSWLDERATEQAERIGVEFDADVAFAVTGEPQSSATWPTAKLRWLREREPASLERAAAVLMIKDDLILRLTGDRVGEATTRGFTYFTDVRRGEYWPAMLDHCGVDPATLPPIAPAGSDAGPVLPAVREELPPARGWRVNAGALDHFCSMVGTGSYAAGAVSESSGTVLSLSVLAEDWSFDPARRTSFHAGLLPGQTLLFTGADAGGVVLEWFRRESLADLPWPALEAGLSRRGDRPAPIFLPHLTGVNPPDFSTRARGAFVGLELQHDRFDLAFAVEEGLAHLLKRNLEALEPDGAVRSITSTGGGASSPHWCQLKADVCGVEVVVPEEQEATCRGAAVLALVEAGRLDRFEDARHLNEPPSTRYEPHPDARRADRFAAFEDAYDRLYGG